MGVSRFLNCTNCTSRATHHILSFQLIFTCSKCSSIQVLLPLNSLVAYWLATCARRPKVSGSGPAASFVQR